MIISNIDEHSFSSNILYLMLRCKYSIVLIIFMLYRNGLSADSKKMSLAEMMPDDIQVAREERAFRLWINSLGIATYVNNLFEDVRNG